MRDLYSNIKAAHALVPAVRYATVTGTTIDLKGSNRAAVVVSTGDREGTGGFSLKLQESDTTTSGDFADVAAALVDSDAPATLAGSSVYRLGYRGHKRYIRLVATASAPAGITIGAIAVLSDLAQRPA